MAVGKFRLRERIAGLSEQANRELRRIQADIQTDLTALFSAGPFSELERSNIEAKVGQFKRVSPRGAMVVTLEAPRRDTQGQDVRIMVESMASGTLSIRAHAGTVNGVALLTLSQPGLVVCTSNGVDNYAVTFAAGSQTTAAVDDIPEFTVVSNPSSGDAQPSTVAMALHSVLARIAGDVVSHPFSTLFGARLTYDTGTGVVSADDQTSALTASDGVTRSGDNFQEETQIAQSVKVNATDSVARPLPLALGGHTFLANIGSGIVARAFSSFFGARLTYDTGTGTVSADDQTSALTASNGVSRVVDDFQLATVNPNETLVNASGSTAVPSGLLTNGHSFLGRFGGNVESRFFSTFFATGLSYDTGTGTVSVTNPAGNLTASGGVSRVVDDFRLADMFGNSIWVKVGSTTGAPTNLSLGTRSLFGRPTTGDAGSLSPSTHTMVGRIAGDIVGHSLFTLFGGANLSYDGAGQASSFTPVQANSLLVNSSQITLNDSATVTWSHSNLSGVSSLTANASVTLPTIGGNTLVGNPTASTAARQAISVFTHSLLCRKGGNIANFSLSSLAGTNMSYNSGTGAFDVSLSAAGRLIAATALSGSGTHNFNASTARIVVELKGGGGGGAGAGTAADKGAAGGGEGALIVVHRTSPGSSMSFSVGGGGSAGGTTPTAGGSGSSSSVTISGSTYTAGGGGGGAQAQGTGGNGMGGAGGSASGATTGRLKAIRGAPGGCTPIINADAATAFLSGAGGGQGGGLARLHDGTEGAGQAGAAGSGGGGSGGFNSGTGAVSGGAGGSGYIVVYEYS